MQPILSPKFLATIVTLMGLIVLASACSEDKSSGQSSSRSRSKASSLLDIWNPDAPQVSSKNSWTRISEINSANEPGLAWVEAVKRLVADMPNAESYPASLSASLDQLETGQYYAEHEIKVDEACYAEISLSSPQYNTYMRVQAISEKDGVQARVYEQIGSDHGATLSSLRLILVPEFTYRVLVTSEHPGEIGEGILTLCKSDRFEVTMIDSYPANSSGTLNHTNIQINRWTVTEDGWLGTASNAIALFYFEVQEGRAHYADLYVERVEIYNGSAMVLFNGAGNYIGTANSKNLISPKHLQFKIMAPFTTRPGNHVLLITQGGTTAHGQADAEIPFRVVFSDRDQKKAMMESILQGQ